MRYRTDYLTKAICELRYDPILRLESKLPAELQERVKPDLPRLDVREHVEVTGTLSENAEVATKVSKRFKEYVFHNDENGTSLLVHPSVLRYQQQEYSGKVRYFEAFGKIWDTFREIYGVTDLQRVGLRYVNQIRPGTGNALDWEGLINDSLITGSIGVAGELRHRLSKSAHELRLMFDNYIMTIRFGLLNEDFPAPIAERAFLLDYDCYCADTSDANDLMSNLDTFHTQIERQFEVSIEDGLRDLMGIVDDTR